MRVTFIVWGKVRKNSFFFYMHNRLSQYSLLKSPSFPTLYNFTFSYNSFILFVCVSICLWEVGVLRPDIKYISYCGPVGPIKKIVESHHTTLYGENTDLQKICSDIYYFCNGLI